LQLYVLEFVFTLFRLYGCVYVGGIELIAPRRFSDMFVVDKPDKDKGESESDERM